MTWLPKRRVVVPVDFSELSLDAVSLALGLVKDASHVHAVHVLPTLAYTDPGVTWEKVDDEGRKRHAMEHLRERLRGPDREGITLHVGIGDPGHESVAYAERVGADLIVLPSHGRTGMRRLLIGSCAERVVRLAHCPVLVIRD